MKLLRSFLLLLQITSSVSLCFAQGLKFDEGKAARFSEAKDDKVGLTLIDSSQNIVWMRCAVEQEFDATGKKECKGKSAVMTFQQAVAFTSKIGDGWRLPTLWEVESASDTVRRMLAEGDIAPRGKYGGGGWDCGGMSIWTATGVTGEPNRINAPICTIFTSGSAFKRDTVSKFGEDKSSLILVKSAR